MEHNAVLTWILIGSTGFWQRRVCLGRLAIFLVCGQIFWRWVNDVGQVSQPARQRFSLAG